MQFVARRRAIRRRVLTHFIRWFVRFDISTACWEKGLSKMMRKDVKLGFAIGGVLLAVLVVYMLVGTGSSDHNNGGAALVTEDTAGKSAPPKVAEIPKPPVVDSSTLNNSANSVAGNIGGHDPTISTPTTAPSLAANDANPKPRDPNQDLWNSALNEGQLLISKTPDAPGNIPGGPVDRTQVPPRASSGNVEETKGAASNTGTVASNIGSDPAMAPISSLTRSNDTPSSSLAGPATRPSDESRSILDSGKREHIVKPGETLSLIAQAAYGNANFYPAILRANPNLDPKKMKPGMTITLPAASDVRPDVKPSGTSDASQSSTLSEVDAKSQYRVQSNDSLYRIAMKLYGKPEMVSKIYDLNKETIGSDPAKLKLNMLLKLPEPPTQSASR